ncbi:MAG: hypothetical protein MJ219_02600 [Mycoplasmoidaceae bacterium]|nr:hypothetical protein [Mycoplasmoidaceae bacterium]
MISSAPPDVRSNVAVTVKASRSSSSNPVNRKPVYVNVADVLPSSSSTRVVVT